VREAGASAQHGSPTVRISDGSLLSCARHRRQHGGDMRLVRLVLGTNVTWCQVLARPGGGQPSKA